MGGDDNLFFVVVFCSFLYLFLHSRHLINQMIKMQFYIPVRSSFFLQDSGCGGADENADPNPRRRGRKRRSLTESHPAKNPLMTGPQPPGNIFFETDL